MIWCCNLVLLLLTKKTFFSNILTEHPWIWTSQLLICQKPAHFLFPKMADLSMFLQIFVVFGMYNFVKKLKEKETTNQRGYLLRKLALNSFGSGWKVIKQKHEFEDLKVTFWDTDIHSLFTSVHILLLTIELESIMSDEHSAILHLLPI